MRRQSRDPRQVELGFSPEEMTHVSESDWTPPAELPDRLEGDVIGVDLETEDRGIREGRGAGWAWSGGGRVIGYAIHAKNFSNYLPIGHVSGNMDPDVVRRWVAHVLSDERQIKIGASTMYDLGWARRDGVEIRGPVYDVQWIEALLDENRFSYQLDAIARDRLGIRKDERLLREAGEAYGFGKKVKENLHRLPAKYVGAYGALDARLPVDLWSVYRPLLDEEDLWDVFHLEHDLLPMYLDMRTRGIRIDQSRVEIERDRLRGEVEDLVKEIRRRTGVEVSIWAADSISKAFDKEGIPYPTTAKTGQPSITKTLLEKTDHWLADMIRSAREKDKMVGTFYEGQLLNQLHGDRVHGEIHPLRGEGGGTVSGRISMSNPNLQFIPTRTEEGKEIRKAFLAEYGERWSSADFSQQEPRLLVHFAAKTKVRGKHIRGALEARDRYLNEPGMSYHDFAAELTGLPYKAAKILNLAIIYGRGVKNTSVELGLSIDETRRMFNKHAEEMPFAKEMARVAQEVVEDRGYIRSLWGRKNRFPFFEPRDWDQRDGKAYPLEQARQVWADTPLIRARLNKALNSLIQPSAADQTKLAMRAVWREGLGQHVLVQVHDELGCSIPDTVTGERIAEVMREAVKLEVPSKVDLEIGPSWGEAK